MRLSILATVATLALVGPAVAAVTPPDTIRADGVPELSDALQADVANYTEFNGASFVGFDPKSNGILISRRAGNVTHLHRVTAPLAKPEQLTKGDDPVSGAAYAPSRGDVILYAQDKGGAEFWQLYRLDPKSAAATLVTDGKSRNQTQHWNNDGTRVAYASTRRNGKDNDIWVMDPRDPSTDKIALQVDGGGEGWTVTGWSPDGKKLLVNESISINESYVWLVDIAAGTKTAITPRNGIKGANDLAQFDPSGEGIWYASDVGAESKRLVRYDVKTGNRDVVTPDLRWDVEELAMPTRGDVAAYFVNEAGRSVLHLIDLKTRKERPAPKLPEGQIGTARISDDGSKLGLGITSAKSPGDVFVVDLKNGNAVRWTTAETGNMKLDRLREPELVKLKSFDGLEISGFYYRPDPKAFPGKRPVIIDIHGGPEGQSRPKFLGRAGYLVAELGVGIFYPNVRGSEGYGKTFLELDDGMKREDSVKDIGAVIDWLKADGATDGARIGVQGGSYGGYMTLAVMTHYSDRLRAAIDVVGISNFVTFLTNTSPYRQDLRRVEYGDERDPAMREFLQKISPLTNVAKITKPMLVVQGANDPRVPKTEADQMVQALRTLGTPTWYVVGLDEGHGFKKKKNADYQFLSGMQFWKQHLLAPSS
ncbi:S9 family peptidase [Roseiterribacter gracilis]|uniref:Peptidase S9 family protein n=1 Tax=Roseiterribacter gracilis TaxID=2812848 RepID=A0A8S8XGE7_9PROT|nr:peptidase S9 family protein [Rhodospirillales bacterium TMPK1]